MKLLTKSIETKLISNFHENQKNNGNTFDFKPVVKFFNPCGAATWLFTELDPKTNILYGLCDLGFGSPELGYASLDEIKSVRLPFGLSIERDKLFTASKTLIQYSEDASIARRIIT